MIDKSILISIDYSIFEKMENPLVNNPNVGLEFVYNDGGRSKYFKG